MRGSALPVVLLPLLGCTRPPEGPSSVLPSARRQPPTPVESLYDHLGVTRWIRPLPQSKLGAAVLKHEHDGTVTELARLKLPSYCSGGEYLLEVLLQHNRGKPLVVSVTAHRKAGMALYGMPCLPPGRPLTRFGVRKTHSEFQECVMGRTNPVESENAWSARTVLADVTKCLSPSEDCATQSWGVVALELVE